MKKTMIVLLALLMAVSVFTGCEVRNPLYDGSSAVSATAEPSSEPEPTEEPSEVSQAESSFAESSKDFLDVITGDSDEAKIKAYVDLIGDTIEKSMTNESMSLRLEARGTAMAYICTVYDIGIDDSAALADYLDSYTTALDSTYEQMLDQLQTEVGITTASIVIEYVDGSGNIIYTKEYK